MRTSAIGRLIASALLALAGLFLGWQTAAAYPWSNGWMEGLSYALGAAALATMAGLVASGKGRHVAMYGCVGVLLAIPGAWCLRWTMWLLTRGPEIGPIPPYVPLGFGRGTVAGGRGAPAAQGMPVPSVGPCCARGQGHCPAAGNCAPSWAGRP